MNIKLKCVDVRELHWLRKISGQFPQFLQKQIFLRLFADKGQDQKIGQQNTCVSVKGKAKRPLPVFHIQRSL